MNHSSYRNSLVGIAGVSMLALALSTAGAAPPSQKAAANAGFTTLSVDLKAFDMPHMAKYGLKYFPKVVELTQTKPAGIRKEPSYKGTPKYGTIHLGNGPQATYVIALDEPDPGDSHLYIDINHNGDLTDDGSNIWVKQSKDNGVWFYQGSVVLEASYGTPKRETTRAPYALGMYHRGGDSRLMYYRQSARAGVVTLKGKPHKALLVENDSDGIYSKPVDDDGKPLHGGKATLPVWLLVDQDDVGFVGMGAHIYDIRSPFVVQGTNYEAVVSPDGSRIKLAPTTRAVVDMDRPVTPPPSKLLADGKDAPDFTVEALDGHPLKLSDFKGKIVVLDFWATWCGPCNASMPHLQRVYDAVKDKDVVVLGVCVADEKSAFQQWVNDRSKRFTFPLAFDPAGRNQATSISSHLYGVEGIPTTFIIDQSGKVVTSVVGFGGDKDKRIEEALAKLNVQVVETSASAR